MKKCYDKQLEYVVPYIMCGVCEKHITPGEELHVVTVTYGNGIHTCKECADKFQVDFSMRFTDDEEEDDH